MDKLRVGIDIGSTTIKVVAIDPDDTIVHQTYVRHLSNVSRSLRSVMDGLQETIGDETVFVNFTGSAGLSMAKAIGVQFTQEVLSATTALRHHRTDIDVCIELGGEDAKIIFFDGVNIEQRMNGTCAGGTGAFIDQMASLLDTDAAGINELAKGYEKIHDIASRCGVFAKTDIQPLINQGARPSDIAASIYQAIVNQTIAGLSQGRKIKGRVAFLGGPLTFSSELRRRFIEFLDLKDVFVPDNGEVFVAYGAALEAKETMMTVPGLREKIHAYRQKYKQTFRSTISPLFKNDAEYKAFKERHNRADVERVDPQNYRGAAYLGVDAGSTTTKLVLLSEDRKILHTFYAHNRGHPMDMAKKAMLEMYDALHPSIVIKKAYATGYGEALIQNAFKLDGGEVETVCHYEAAKHFDKDVSFVVDIGGQDMKCFKIENNVVTAIILNEACSSGCGSFIETFSESLGHEIRDFAAMAVEAQRPVDLGSRCTVFMNSSVKQAQSEAASSKDISAGLAVSVVKNALYKVIRAHDIKEEYGEHIIVQGGTFNNDAVLRAFERETGVEVIRPSIAGLMGAFGAALIAQKNDDASASTMLTAADLQQFTYQSKPAVCRLCSNYCALTINIFNDDARFISGNRCEKGAGLRISYEEVPNLYLYKYDKVLSYRSDENRTYDATVGLPLVMNMYENLPFWQPFFDTLNVKVVLSERSTKALYERGQDTIPSDTVCYPAKLVHGHMESLYDKRPDFIFYPNIPFNFVEKAYADNHYNCPIVAHYPEVVEANMDHLDMRLFIQPYLTLNDPARFAAAIHKSLSPHISVTTRDIKRAYTIGMRHYNAFRKAVQHEGERALSYAEENGLNVIVLAGRPYHIDPEINHGIPRLIRSMNVVVISEDALNHLASQSDTDILNQWTYHTRLYDVARYVSNLEHVNLVQLVSFGCGLDAITGDEVKAILERAGKLYTQIKIDEISNLGAAKIRLRSLLSTMGR